MAIPRRTVWLLAAVFTLLWFGSLDYRALIKPDELLQDTRADEAFLLLRGARPLRCGRAVWFRRPEWQGLVDQNRFHASGRDAAA